SGAGSLEAAHFFPMRDRWRVGNGRIPKVPPGAPLRPPAETLSGGPATNDGLASRLFGDDAAIHDEGVSGDKGCLITAKINCCSGNFLRSAQPAQWNPRLQLGLQFRFSFNDSFEHRSARVSRANCVNANPVFCVLKRSSFGE